MAGATANIFPTLQVDGLAYAVASLVPAAEGDVYNGTIGNPGTSQPGTPWPVQHSQGVVATVTLTAQGQIGSQTTYIVMQTRLSDGTWVDVAWCTWTGTQGSVTFVLAGGFAGAISFQQRAASVAPSPANGSNQFPLGGQVRFVGKSSVTGSSSSSSAGPGVVTGVLATVTFKLVGIL